MPSYVFTNLSFVTGPGVTSWAVNGPFPIGTVVSLQFSGVSVTAPCGQYGYACNIANLPTTVGTGDIRFALGATSGTASWTMTAAGSGVGGAFYTDGYCSTGTVAQLTVTTSVAAGTACEHGTQLQPTANFVYYLTPGLIDLWLGSVGMPWLAPVFTAFWFSSFNAQELCGSLPPPVPTIDLSTLESSIATAAQLLKCVAWPNVCQCVPGSPNPTPPPSPTQPQPPGWITPPALSCSNTDICAALISMQAQLQAIQKVVGDDLGLTTLLQRYRLPFAYVPGATHSGLTGSGSFAVTRLTGLRIVVTQAGTDHKHLMGTPPYVWNLGWVSVSDGGAMLQELRIARDSQDWAPAEMQLATQVGWSVAPDVIFSITELEPEP